MFTNIFFLILCLLNVHPPQRCRLNSRQHFGEPLPVILRNGRLLEPTDKYGNVDLEKGDILTLSCISEPIRHPSASKELATANIICDSGTSFINDEWLTSNADFVYFSCYHSPDHSSKRTNRTCYSGHSIIEVGYKIENEFYPLYESCFDQIRMNPIYSKYTQYPYNAKYQTGVNRLFFIDDDNYYGSIPVESSVSIFSPWNQKTAVAHLVGSVIDEYCNNNQQLSRGHLAARTDFVFAFGERASFHYVNCAPQWTGFNGGNWNTLEVDLRNHIYNSGYETVIYTGTYGVTQLLDDNRRRVDIYLSEDNNNDPVIPVPQYFYKVVYEPSTKRGVAFVGINNPYYNKSEAEDLYFCNNVCKNNYYTWLTWNPNNPDEGYTFCCELSDFRNTVRHLPEFEVKGLFI